MSNESRLKITVCKHSAARTAVEQAADTGVMFKKMKRIINDTDNPHALNSSVYQILDQSLSSLHSTSIQEDNTTSNKVLNLLCHKKKAILSTVSKLPTATSRAYSNKTIKKVFMLNGQLDVSHKLVPSLNNLMHTYRGNIEGICLTSKETLVGSIYEECYTTGIVSKGTFDGMKVPKDHDNNGDIVNRDVKISQENCQ